MRRKKCEGADLQSRVCDHTPCFLYPENHSPSEWFSGYKKKSKAALAALLFSCGCAQNLLVKAFSHRLNQIGHRDAQKSP